MPTLKYFTAKLYWYDVVADTPAEIGGDVDTDPDTKGINGAVTITPSVRGVDLRAIKAPTLSPNPAVFALAPIEARIDDGRLKMTASQEDVRLVANCPVLELPEDAVLVYEFKPHHVTYNKGPQTLPTITIVAPEVADDSTVVVDLAEVEWLQQGAGLGGVTYVRQVPDGVELTADDRVQFTAQGQPIGAPLELAVTGVSAASGAMRNLMAKLTEGVTDATWLALGDSTGNENDEWIYLTTQWLATRFPDYTVNYYLWDEGGNAWPGSPTVIQTGTGPFALTVWNASVPGSKTGYFQGSRFPNVVKNADLVTINYGHNQGGPVNTDSLRQFQRNKYLSFVDEVSEVNPAAGVVCVLQNPSVDGAFSHDIEWQGQRAVQYAQAAANRGWGVVNILRAFYDYGDWGADLTESDGIHPNPQGSLLWAAHVQAALVRAARISVTTQLPRVAASRQILTNSEFTAWSGTNPDGVTLSAGVTTSKELSDYETGVQALKLTTDTTEGQPYAEWGGTADSLGIKGLLANRTWTLAVRLKVPAANTSVVRVYLRDNNGSSQSVYSDVDDTARDRYLWVYVTKQFASNATSVSARVCPKTYGTTAVSCTVDRILLVPGAVPATG